jgi:hypothetical protein
MPRARRGATSGDQTSVRTFTQLHFRSGASERFLRAQVESSRRRTRGVIKNLLEKSLMKKLKVLAAAVAMALGTQAHAAYTGVGDQTTGSSLMFFAWNATTSYARDLGIKLSDVLDLATPGAVNTATGPATSWQTPGALFSFAGTTLFQSTFGSNLSGVSWNIAAGDGTPLPQQFAMTIDGAAPNLNLTSVGNVVGKMNGIFNATFAATGLCPVASECVAQNGTDVAYAGANANWGSTAGATVADNAGTGTGSVLDFWYYKAAGTGLGVAPKDQFNSATDNGHWTLASDGTATYSLAGSPVPLPAGIWLFGSGLFGLIGIARRRKQTA